MPDPEIAPDIEITNTPALAPASTLPESLVPGAPDIAPGVGGEGALAFFNPDALPFVLLVIVGTAIAVRLTQRVSDRVAERVMQHRLAIKQAVTLIGFAAYGVAGIVVVRALFDLSAQAIFALSGTLAVAGGFLLKDLAEATFAGVSILITRPFQVGDRIHFGEYYGEVKEIGLRSVRLVTLDDNLVSIPSNRFLTEPVASANAGELDCMVVIPFFITPSTDHRRAKSIIHDAILSSRFLYLGKPVTVQVSMRLAAEVGAVVELTAKAYVYDARHENSFSSDVTDRVLRAFRTSHIEMPVRVGAA